MGKVILFLRVSSEKQQLASQELIARRMAHADGYSDENILPPIQYKESASRLEEKDRQGLQELYKTLEERNDIDAVYLTELSRASRKPNVLYAFRDYLLDKKIQLVCGEPSFRLLNKQQQLDKMASLVFAIFGAFAEQEIIEKRERFARGKEQRALEGKYTGGNLPFGYKIGDNKKIEIDYVDDEGVICGNARIVQLIFNLYESGYSQPKLSRELTRRGYDLVKIGQINHILSNVSYTGELREQRILKVKDRVNGDIKDSILYPRVYPQIISREQFSKCRKIAESNNINISKTKNVYYAEHLMRCVSCGSYLSASGSKNCYHCYSAYKPEGIWNNDYYRKKKCDNKMSISINVLDSLLWYIAIDLEAKFILESSDQRVKELNEKVEAVKINIESIDKAIAKIENKRKRASRTYIDGGIDDDEYEDAKRRIEEEKRELVNERTKYYEEITHYEDAIRVLTEGYINKIKDIQDARKSKDDKALMEAIRKYREIEDEKKLKVYASITSINDDHTRYEIIHRQIESVIVDNIEIYFRYKLGWRKTRAKRVSIIPQRLLRKDNEFLPDKLNYILITNGGFGTKYLDENEDIDVIYDSTGELDDMFGYVRYEEDGYPHTYQLLHVEQLHRFDDAYKRDKRRQEKINAYKCVEGYRRIEDIMSLTNLSYGQVYSAIDNGTLKAKIVRHKCFIAPDDAQRFISNLEKRRDSRGDKLSAFEIAKRFNLKYNYVLRRVKNGKLASEHIDGEYLVSIEDAERFFSVEHEGKKGRDMDGYLSAATVAKKYGVSYKSVRKKIRLGEIPSTMRKGYYYVDPKDAADYYEKDTISKEELERLASEALE